MPAPSSSPVNRRQHHSYPAHPMIQRLQYHQKCPGPRPSPAAGVWREAASRCAIVIGSVMDGRDVAQFGSALDWGSRGRRFKSGRPDQEVPGQRPLCRFGEVASRSFDRTLTAGFGGILRHVASTKCVEPHILAGSAAPGSSPRREHGYGGDLVCGQVVPVEAAGAPLRFAFDHFACCAPVLHSGITGPDLPAWAAGARHADGRRCRPPQRLPATGRAAAAPGSLGVWDLPQLPPWHA